MIVIYKRGETMKATPWKLLLEIFLTFFKIGPVTFGGGYAMIPLIEREVVENKKWVKLEDVTDVFALSESVPGAIAINSATFIGFRIAGVRGAFAAMLGILLPTFLIIIGLSITFQYFKDNPKVEAAFVGIRPAIVALITFAAYKIGKMALVDKTTLVTALVTLICLLILPIHPLVIIVSGAIAGIIMVKIRDLIGLTTKLEETKKEDCIETNSEKIRHAH